jgi:hypothetical protein
MDEATCTVCHEKFVSYKPTDRCGRCKAAAVLDQMKSSTECWQSANIFATCAVCHCYKDLVHVYKAEFYCSDHCPVCPSNLSRMLEEETTG